MSNLIQNPNLGNWGHVRYFSDQEGKSGTIEAPQHWEFVTIARESDPHKLPQSLHRDTGFIISAGYRAWEAGYKQGGLALEANCRYRLKATIKADVNFPGGQSPDLTAITWRFTVGSNKGKIEPEWAITSKGRTKQVEAYEFVFETAEALIVDITFWGRSFYAGNDCDLWLYEVTLEPVDKSYGASQVPTLGNAAPDAPPVKNIPEKTDDDSILLPDVDKVVGTSGKGLGDVLNDKEIDTISDGLRALADSANDTKATIGLHKLAEAFQRLKQS